MAHDDLLAELLFQATALRGEAREEFVRDVEGQDVGLGEELRSLLAHADRTDPLRSAHPSSLGDEDDPLLNTFIDSYRIDRLLGRGGMGRVYSATQRQPLHRTVAIKVIHPGMDSEAVLRRFRNERRSLASLQHPNVARILDAGTDERCRPYLVMELADGPTLTEYCDTRRCSDREKVELLLQACEGVAHAHARGILHRDLKPSNILVVQEAGGPVAKVIDFGVAALLEPTRNGSQTFEPTSSGGRSMPVGTPGWMSPEQLVGAPLDARADVYAMGLVLYRLIAGCSPWDEADFGHWTPEQIAQHMRRTVPEPPSRRLRATRGSSSAWRSRSELDWICLRAISAEPERRYRDVRGLILDLERYLAGTPVHAAPPSFRYRLRKYVQRHRGPLLVSAALVVVSGTIITVLHQSNVRIRAAQSRTLAALEDTRIAADYLGGVLSSENPHVTGPQSTVRQMVLGSLQSFDADTAGSARVRAWVRPVLATALVNLDEFAIADRQLELAEDEVHHAFGEASVEMAHLCVRVAALRDAQHRMDDAYGSASRAVRILEQLDQPFPEVMLRAMSFRGLAKTRLGDSIDEGDAMLESAMDYANEHGLGESLQAIHIGVWRAGRARLAGEHGRAEDLLRELLERAMASRDPRAWSMVTAVQAELGALLVDAERCKEAVPVLSDAVAKRTEHLGPDDVSTLSVRESRAIALLMSGERTEAVDEFEEVVARMEAVMGARAGRVLTLRANLMGMRIATRRVDDVLQDAPSLIDDLSEHHGEDSIQAAQAMAVLGKALLLDGQHEQAEAQLADAARRYEAKGATGLRIYGSIRSDLEAVRAHNARDAAARRGANGR